MAASSLQVAGLIAEHFEPVVGGLFLVFPAIFPTAATMLEKHEREKKERAGFRAGKRGRMVAGVDAGGAALGTLGLVAFVMLVWKLLPGRPTWFALTIAFAGLTIVSSGLWWVRRLL